MSNVEKKSETSHIVLSFDDGRADNFRLAKEILIPYRIPATFNITTAYVAGVIDEHSRPCPNEAMTVEMVRDLAGSSIFEIAAHGHQHQNTLEDINMGVQQLNAWLPSIAGGVHGFASPHSNMPLVEVQKKMSKYQEMGFRYIRLGVPDEKVLGKRVCRKLSTYIPSSSLYKAAFNGALRNYGQEFVYYSLPVMHKAKVSQVQSLVQRAIQRKQDCILMFHSVLKPGEPYYEDTWSWDYDRFRVLCNFLLKEQKEKLVITLTPCLS